jgi:peptide chain release factor 1
MYNLKDSILPIIEKFQYLNSCLENETDHKNIIKLSKEKSEIEDLSEKGILYLAKIQEIADLEIMLQEGEDPSFIVLIKQEIEQLKEAIIGIEKELEVLLIPKDPLDDKNAIIEIRAGTGGDEASLFAADLLKMYERYSEKQNWRCEIINISLSEVGGVKEVALSINGKGVFGKMRFESGTHRVQRIPDTENNGRVHTSAATVAVFPEIDEIDIKINETDLRVDVFRSSGAGGQHINKTESAVRITHIPTQIVVVQQDNRSQIKNREMAMKILRAKLYEHEEAKRVSEITQSRRNQIGSGDRSEKIRTYNFPQNRLTDHRVNFTNYNMEQLMESGNLDELISILRADYTSSIIIK